MDLKTNRKSIYKSGPRSSRKIVKIALIISFLFHAGLLLVIQKAFPVKWVSRPLRTFHVEFIRSPVDNTKEIERTDLAVLRSNDKVNPEETEHTISLDTKDKRYSSYAEVIKERLMHHWNYPQQAFEDLIEGDVLVLFRIDRHGHLSGIRILRSSDFNILDNGAEKAIRDAAPFSPFPSSVTVSRLNIRANFAYRLTAKP